MEGNYLVTLAYQYTSVTSVTLLDSATIPFVMVLSAIVFRWGRCVWSGCQKGTTSLPVWRRLYWSCTSSNAGGQPRGLASSTVVRASELSSTSLSSRLTHVPDGSSLSRSPLLLLLLLSNRSQYRLGHMVGCLLCTGGLLVLVLTDSASETGGNRPLLGDALVVAGAAVYAVCNIAQVRMGKVGKRTSGADQGFGGA